ncbi:DUF2934 domain-containing protein [Methylobacterium sp. WL64]|uniref:DUF2934 domain-containing protein n=1 Tax=Methylobacterium sp. WL64 TaxID=2603894 RepID=UPI0011CBA3D2|nr:DUF2934 domain-containing protein [Methylobacterium sp. WL64]TXM99005.1 DUF2934 domain-containing protein [Methylobacterium sp. WL64]
MKAESSEPGRDARPAPDPAAPEPAVPESGPRPPPSRTEDKSAPDAIPFEEIRERAYELWERNHRPEGFEIEFWLLAERELRKERSRK